MAKSIAGKYVKTHAAGGSEDLALTKVDEIIAAYNKLQADYAALRTKFVAVLAKLDLDAGVTDVNYASLHTPAAATSAQISKTAAAVLMQSPKTAGV
jgi:hypothetical protein